MAYTTVEDVRLALANLGETGIETAASLDDITIEGAISDGDAELDGYLCTGYTIPVADPGLFPPLARYATTLGAWYATLTFRKARDLEPTDPVQRRRDAVIAILTRVLSGEIQLPIPGRPGDAGSGSVFNVFEGDLFDHLDWLPGEAGYPSHLGSHAPGGPVHPWPRGW